MDAFPFLRFDYKSTFRRDWLLCEGDQGCTPFKGGLSLLMEKSPPPLPESEAVTAGRAKVVALAANPNVTAAPAPPPPPKKDGATALLEWMIDRRDKKQARPAQDSSPHPVKLPKALDLYELPAAMRAAGFPIAAQLCQQWLDGRAYTAYGAAGKEGRYDSDMVNLRTVSLDWLRGHAKIERRYQTLLGKLSTATAQNALRDNFTKYFANHSSLSHELNTREHARSDWQALHADFQFQLETVGMVDTLTDSMGMTDVTASMANFAFYAAVARAHIKTSVYNVYNTPSGTQACRKSTVQVTHVWVYAKDSYSFHDEGASSQYLGHWNKNGVIVLPAAVAASVGMKKIAEAARDTVYPPLKDSLKWLSEQRIEVGSDNLWRYPMDIGRSLAEKDVYYPVYNRDHQQWRELHQRGGDFLIMTEPKLIKLDRPIVIDMPEVCK